MDELNQTEALRQAAQVIRDYVAKEAPTGKAGESFKVRKNGDHFEVTSLDAGAVMSNTGARHPVFARGPRSHWDWKPQNVRHPERTGYVLRAAERAADDANNKFADAVLRQVYIDNPGLNRGRR